MTRSRRSQLSLIDTPYYHCISRCVRRAFLCGQDNMTQQSFEHRRQWVTDRMHFLATVFNVDICAYVIMSNHYHLVLHVDELSSRELTDKEICLRWGQLHSMPDMIQRWLNGQITSTANPQVNNRFAIIWSRSFV